MKPVVARGLHKEYDEVTALRNFSLSVAPGELVALVGHNGSGKSTFLRIAAGLLDRTDGEILLAGHEPGSIEARREVSFIPDDPVLYDDLTVNEHIDYLTRLHGVEGRPERADGLLALLDLTDRADDLPARFSRGLRQKTSLVLGLTRPFTILLVDEPYVGLDPSGQHVLTELLVECASAGAAVVVATHQLSFLDHASTCVALRDGMTEFSGPVDRARIEALLG
jgi:ABC-type multidrug transport system ATPase subunit